MAQSNQYAYQTSLQVEQALALRLNDTANVFWKKAELNLYIAEALRVWNCLTQPWEQEWTASYTQPNPASLPAWQSTANSANALVGSNPSSPRHQTLSDSDVYTLAQYHLLEPATGNGTWTGTSQFTLADFSQALQRRRDNVLQIAGCNVGPFSSTLGLPVGNNRVLLPDTTSQSILDLRRIRFVPAAGLGSPSTLYREDGMAFEYFNNSYLQTNGIPLGWDVLAGPPLFITFDAMASVPNTLDVLAMLSGGLIAPPAASPLLIPDDFSWVLKFGMMADLLRKEEESTDLARATYCEQRFREGVLLMMEMPWLTQARINNVPCDTPSVVEADSYDNEWQSNPSAQIGIVRGGIDLFAVSPTIPAGATVAVTLSLIGNAPVPVADADFIQVSRDVLDAVLDEAQHLAMFKEGGKSFADSMPLHKNFIKTALQTSSRLRESGIFATTLRPPVSRQDEAMPRFAAQEK
jgi:hypothetical protein